MASITDIICASTDKERESARNELAMANAVAPSDLEVLSGFVNGCITLDGKALALDGCGQIVPLNP